MEYVGQFLAWLNCNSGILTLLTVMATFLHVGVVTDLQRLQWIKCLKCEDNLKKKIEQI